MFPVTGTAYSSTLKNRACFNEENRVVADRLVRPFLGADFFVQIKQIMHRNSCLHERTAGFAVPQNLRGRKKEMKVYKKIMNGMAAVEKLTLLLSMLLILVLTVGNVFSRKVIHRSWSFTEELVVAVFVLTTLLAAALACREGELVSLTIFTEKLPKKLQKPSQILITLLSLIFTVILFKYGMDKVLIQLANGKHTFVLNWPEWIFWSFVPIGAGCMILHLIEHCIDVCVNTKEKEDR